MLQNLQIYLLQKYSTIIKSEIKNNLQNFVKYENKILKIINNNNSEELTK